MTRDKKKWKREDELGGKYCNTEERWGKFKFGQWQWERIREKANQKRLEDELHLENKGEGKSEWAPCSFFGRLWGGYHHPARIESGYNLGGEW